MAVHDGGRQAGPEGNDKDVKPLLSHSKRFSGRFYGSSDHSHPNTSLHFYDGYVGYVPSNSLPKFSARFRVGSFLMTAWVEKSGRESKSGILFRISPD
eukprot:4625371-Pyramimonas_sp.AAC.1